MDIVGLGEQIVQQLVREGIIHSSADLYTLTRRSGRIGEIWREKARTW